MTGTPEPAGDPAPTTGQASQVAEGSRTEKRWVRAVRGRLVVLTGHVG